METGDVYHCSVREQVRADAIEAGHGCRRVYADGGELGDMVFDFGLVATRPSGDNQVLDRDSARRAVDIESQLVQGHFSGSVRAIIMDLRQVHADTVALGSMARCAPRPSSRFCVYSTNTARRAAPSPKSGSSKRSRASWQRRSVWPSCRKSPFGLIDQ